ncbi:DUF4349 domain-containing protein [Streptomyces litchfieldiae]|uniref:DUF4349 domain-containing protein n=1 Tax=Streptomyces litchfieldiae TaxID=3075543 RepID=A0ABU2MUA6_9ACTN|nr:DUF4349 domain-containing protein [Streptomyces sp. DSM 44938]MDT0344154.1 DUF4349 domain-containing protein [Streptomyces sp. DSM 44938]
MRSFVGQRGRRVAALLGVPVAGLLALTACSSSSDSEGGGDAAASVADVEEGPGESGENAGPPQEEGTGSGTADEAGPAGEQNRQMAAPDPASAHLIRTASVIVRTDDVAGRHATAVGLAADLGGYVSDENTERDEEGHEVSVVTLKVPGDRYEELLGAVSELGELEHREVTTEDVTDQVVDVESRIATQEESVARIRELLDQARSIDDIVDIEAELSARQADLESLQSQYESLRARTGMATIVLELRQERDPAPEREKEEDDSGNPSVVGALGGGWDAFVTALLWAAAVVSASLPFLVLLALLLLGWRLVHGRLARRAAPAADGPDGPAATP